MNLYSEVTKENYEVKMYLSSYGGYGIDHTSLMDILENRLNVSYDIDILAATASYCAAKCTITDVTGRKVIGMSDINTKLPGGREDVEFLKAHPLLAAANSAVDTAVRSYLKWQRIYSEIADPDTAPFEEDPITDPEMVPMEESLPFDPEFTGMNPPELEDKTETDESEVTEEVTEEIPEMTRIEELGQMYPPKGTKYETMTLKEIYDYHKSWMDFVRKNRSKKYEYVREYIDLREQEANLGNE